MAPFHVEFQEQVWEIYKQENFNKKYVYLHMYMKILFALKNACLIFVY